MHNAMSKATTRTPVKNLKPDETIEHYNAVLLEDIRSKMQQVIEGMDSTKTEIKRELGEFRAEANEHFEMLDTVVREHSGQLQNIERQLADQSKQLADQSKQLADHGKQLAGHGKQLAEINHHLTNHDRKFDAIDKRFDVIETKLDKVGERLDDHEARIINLETARL